MAHWTAPARNPSPARFSRPGCPAIAAAALVLSACGGSDEQAPPDPGPPARVMPAGRLVQTADKGPLTHITQQGWRTHIEGGAITIQPPEASSEPGLQYTAFRMRDQLGSHDLGAWSGDRRTLLLPGGAKLTLHGQAGEILRLSLYDGTESHEIDVLTQTLTHSRVDAAVAQTRESAEADGEAALLKGFFPNSGPSTSFGRLLLANLFVQPADATGAPLRRQAAVRVLGMQSGVDVEVLTPAPPPAAETDTACTATSEPRGRLARLDTGQLEYVTQSGMWTVRIDQHTITTTRTGPANFKWEVWGDPHENLNGKHIKDWEGDRRTLLLDDGTKITMSADGPHQVVHTTSIYDGAQSHEIGNVGNLVRHSCVNAQVATTRDAQEADGEAAYVVNLKGPAMALGYLLTENVYDETEGTQGMNEPVFTPVTLGETGDAEVNPSQVRDYYDDPRLGHT